MEFLILGLVTAFNFVIIKMKLEAKRYDDATLDIILFATVAWLTAGSVAGLMVGIVASAIISVYLYFSPPKFEWGDADDTTS